MEHEKVFKNGLQLCLSNTDLWLSESQCLYEKGSYGHSLALLINGAESLVHAWFCWQVVNGIKKPDDKDIVKVFTEHGIKMNVLFGFILGFVNFDYYLKHKEEYAQKKDYPDEELEIEVKKMVNAEGRFKKEKLELRKQATYVNYDPDRTVFHPPSEIRKEDVDELRQEVGIAYVIVRGLIDHATKEDISIMKSFLNLFFLNSNT